ncbi:efflux transporter outer membrane subunit [Desulfogranum marinum]|uniref:efflux transporter outer membrane subunit n=1 Tax=Desulfogranum marinum TaxID=453220 RepID=UPI0019669395|nr:efflux transporter outer membrane subunit [Desulfogranum marinum]MBM9511683.1 efflux transporter outer membrane subunit [Desulfogranum marinum]
MKKQYLTLFLGCTLLTSCALAPEYKQPQDMVSPSWDEIVDLGQQEGTKTQLASEIPWKDFFQSQELQTVISLGLENNKDLRTAILNIERARATYDIERAERFPKINVGADADLQGDFEGETTTEIYQVGLGVPSYELDFFGRIKNLSEVALNSYLATKSAQQSLTISLISQIAASYLQLVTDMENLQLAQETLSAQNKSYDLIKKSYDFGLSTKLDIAQVRISVETARTDMIRFGRLVQLDKNALVLLLGVHNVNEIPLKDNLGSIALLSDIPIGLPSQVLLKRPDIKQAEYTLRGAGANIGAARANFYPRITLTGQLGFASGNLGDLFDGGGWTFGPSFLLPLFNAGQNKATLEVAKVDQELAVTAYEQTVQTAFREVADELAARETLGKQLEAQRMLVAATQDSYDLSMNRYRQGIDNYLNVLVAQRSLFTAQQGAIEIHRQKLVNQINLYKVLGGGLAIEE